MDSLTHIVLGACIGEVCAGKSLGKKALLVGAVAQSIPDIDFVASFWLSPAGDLLAHRGFTHSFFFILLITYPLSLLAKRWRWLPSMPIRAWSLFILLELFVHLLLDAFNAYGTAWFEPFSHYRISLNSLFVLDPLYSIWPGITAILLLLLPVHFKKRLKLAWLGIILSTLYLGYGLINKEIIKSSIKYSLKEQQISYNRYFSTPTPANVWLWYIVVEDEHGFHIGYRSIFDSQKMIPFQFFSRNQNFLDSISDRKELQYLTRFSEGYYVASHYNDKLVFNDLRFEQMMGWDDPIAPFVFYYYLDHPADNELLIQRGRFTGWDKESMLSFIERIKGV